MAEINNSIALQVQPNNGLDLGKTFMTLAQLQMAQAHAALYGQQAQLQGMRISGLQQYQQAIQGGADPAKAAAGLGAFAPDLSKELLGGIAQQQDIQEKKYNLLGRLGNSYKADPRDETWQGVVTQAKQSGLGLINNDLEEAQYRKLPPDQRMALANRLGGLGQSSEQFAGTSGAAAGAKARAEAPYQMHPAGSYQSTADLAAQPGGVPPMQTNPQYAKGVAALRAGQNVTGAAGAAAANGQLAQPGSPSPAPVQPPVRGLPLGRQKETELEVERGDKTLGGIQAQATQYEQDTKPYLTLARSILNDPKMYTGFGAERVLDWNRIKATWGDNKAAMLQEGLKKVTASSVLGALNVQRDQIQAAGGASSRIFDQQVTLVRQAANDLPTSPAGNRFLVEVSMRTGELASTIAQKARDYKIAHGHLDVGFDNEIANYMKQHPIFSEKELSNIHLLGAPTSPSNDTAKTIAWGREMGLKPGEPIRTPSGKYVGFPSQ